MNSLLHRLIQLCCLISMCCLSEMRLYGMCDESIDPVLLELKSRALRSLKKAESGAAVSWSTKFVLPNDVSVQLDIASVGDITRYRLAPGTGMNWQVVVKDGFWFVDNGKSRIKYRPFEAVSPFPGFLVLLQQCQVNYLTEVEGAQLEADQSLNQTEVKMRLPMTGGRKVNLQNSIAKLKELSESLRGEGRTAEIEKTAFQIQALEETLHAGVQVQVESKTGIILQSSLHSARTTEWLNIEWDPAVNSAFSEINADEWEDRSEAIDASELPDLVQIGWNPLWTPGMPTGDIELMLLNVKSGGYRRVPFPYGIATSGCFSPDRTQIYVSGSNVMEGGLQIFRINIMTGETVPPGDETMQTGIWMNPVISPDGKHLAVSQMLQGEGLKAQIHILDMETQISRPIGVPIDAAFLEWHPDGRSLICAVRESRGAKEIPLSTISQLFPDGTVKPIREGRFPCLLPHQKRILFEAEDRSLETCRLDGSDVKKFVVGSVRMGFPAPSSDGRLMMVKFEPGMPPVPCLVDMTNHELTPIELPPGIWGRPAWR